MALDQDIERLARVPLFALLEPDALRLLAFSGETRIVLADTVLFRRGEASDGGYLILSGSILLTDEAYDTTRLGPGSLLGETALLREVVHRGSAVAEETATLFKLPRRSVLRVLEEHPASARRVLAFLARRLRGALPDAVAAGP
jgi:CRP-like cAMP-binding protein